MEGLALAALIGAGILAAAGGAAGRAVGGKKGMVAGAIGLPVLYVLYSRAKSRRALDAMNQREQQALESWEKLHPGATEIRQLTNGPARFLKKTATPAEYNAYRAYACANFNIYCG